MRARSLRSALVVLALLAVTTIPAEPAGAARPTRPSAASFCTTMHHFLDFMRSAPRPSALRRPHGRTLVRDLRATAPRPVARPAKTLAHSLEYVAAHGRHSLSKQQNAAANASLVATARYVVDHCTSKPVARAYAALLAAAQPTTPATTLPTDRTTADWS